MADTGGVLILLALVGYGVGKPLPPYNLKCEGAPVGLTREKLQRLDRHMFVGTDNPNPALSWTRVHSERAAKQLAFQVVVATDKNMNTIIWDTGKIPTNQTSVTYSGPTLHTGKSYFWKVTWWDHDGEAAVSEETGAFIMATLDHNQWEQAKWIAAPVSVKTAPYIYKTFNIHSDKVQQAAIFICGLGYYRIYINGEDKHAHADPPIALHPGWTPYEFLLPYYAYPVPLSAGENVLSVGVHLGRGWRNEQDFPDNDNGGVPLQDSSEQVLKLYILYYDAQNEPMYLYSDDTWSVDETSIVSDSVYNGEVVDTGRNMSKGLTARVISGGPEGKLYMPMLPYIAEIEVENPVEIYSLKDSDGKLLSHIVDFGYNSAGYCQVQLEDEGFFTLRHAEVPLHEPYGVRDGSLYYDNLRGAKATDTYDGKKGSTYKPTFTYHGFRYAEMKGFYNTSFTEKNIKKIVVHSNVAKNGKFDSSIPLLDRLYGNCVRAQLSNTMSFISDCDQRDERIGFLGDAQLSAESMSMNFDMSSFFDNYLSLIASQIIDGTIPDVVPWYHGGQRPSDPSWGAGFPEFLYRVVMFYNEVDIGAKHYPAVMEYMNTVIGTVPPEGISNLPNCHTGDWVPPDPVPMVNNTLTGSSSFLMNMQQMIEVAKKLNKTEDASKMQQLYEKYIGQYNKGFMTSDTQFLNGIQPTYIFPLAVGSLPEEKETGFVKAFLNHFEDPGKDNSHVTGGIVSSRYVFTVLSKLKQHDLALKTATQLDYPSYGLMIYNNLEPATGLWELWDSSTYGPGMNSRNHHMFSGVCGWMMTDMAGLSIQKGFDEIHYSPAGALGLSHVSVGLQHPKPVHLSWRRNGGIQCTKQAENQSPLNPHLPKYEDLTISCGDEDGGTIQKVLFSSYGNPTGHCGGYHKHGSCHASNSLEVAEKLCLGKRSCVIPTGADFWGNPCPDEIKWLVVSVQCKSKNSEVDDFVYSSIQTNVSVPMGSRGFLHLPAYGKRNMKLWEGGEVIYTEENQLERTLGIVSATWESETDSLAVELESGEYSFSWKGDNPQKKCFDSKISSAEDQLVLKCNNSNDVITTINWASFGSPELSSSNDCFSHVIGECHTGSSKYAIEKECIGKKICAIGVGGLFFGKSHCLDSDNRGRLIVDYTCNMRYVN